MMLIIIKKKRKKKKEQYIYTNNVPYTHTYSEAICVYRVLLISICIVAFILCYLLFYPHNPQLSDLFN